MQIRPPTHSLLILATALAVSFLSSCELETHSNGALDGFWQLQRLDSLPQGSSIDMVPLRRFWSFQARLMKITDYRNRDAVFFLRFAHRGDTLRLYDPTQHKASLTDPDGMDTPLTDPDPLRPYGIQSLEQPFYVLHLSGDRMILECDSLRLHFIKF